MLFIAAKLLDLAIQPLNWVALFLALGLIGLRRRPRAASAVLWAALGLLIVQGWQPLPDALIRQFEARHPAPGSQTDLSHFAGLVVLGGALEPAYVWTSHDQPALNDGAERMTAGLPLLQRYPGFQLLFTGGEGELLAHGLSEAERARIFYQSMGVPPQRLIFEAASRTTYENAVLSAALPGVDKTRPWLLVTSAFHMPRAMGVFQKAGWNVIAYPVDYRTGDETPWSRYSLVGGAGAWHLALHELAGLLSYRLMGYL
jgi:uncharacterized SAM-binding protein YcdF (DUF218 family)